MDVLRPGPLGVAQRLWWLSIGVVTMQGFLNGVLNSAGLMRTSTGGVVDVGFSLAVLFFLVNVGTRAFIPFWGGSINREFLMLVISGVAAFLAAALAVGGAMGIAPQGTVDPGMIIVLGAVPTAAMYLFFTLSVGTFLRLFFVAIIPAYRRRD